MTTVSYRLSCKGARTYNTFSRTNTHTIEDMWYKLCSTIFYLQFTWAFASPTFKGLHLTSTTRRDVTFKIFDRSVDITSATEEYSTTVQSIPVGKTRVTCLNSTRRTTVEDAEAYIAQLSAIPWFYQNVTWGTRRPSTIGHLPLTMTSGTTQLIIFSKDGSDVEDSMVMADSFKVMHDIVKDCIAQDQYTGGKAYIGPRGILAIALTGLYHRDLRSGSNMTLTGST